MARSVFAGSISFGMVSIPVKAYTATTPAKIPFKQLSPKGNRINLKRTDVVTGEDIAWNDLVKGYEVSPDRFVLVSDDELDALAPEATSAITITDFTDAKSIDPLLYDAAYYLAADKGAGKAHGLLIAAMRKTDKVAIGSFVMNGKSKLAVLRPGVKGEHADTLVCETLVYADEVNNPDAVSREPTVKATTQEVKMAVDLIKSMATDFNHSAYIDEYRAKVQAMLDAKAAGETIDAGPKADKTTTSPNLMAALEASLAAQRTPVKSARQLTAVA